MDEKTIHTLLLNYFLSINLNYVTIFNCWSSEDNHQLLKSFSSSSTFVEIVNLNDSFFNPLLEAKRIDNRSRVKIGIALEFGCLNSVDFLLKCSAKQCFSTSIQWFLFSLNDPDKIIQHLSKADLYIDAEVKFLTDDGLYDVYNNGRPLGGALNVTLDRPVKHGTLGPSRHSGKPKYQHRRNMSDITMRVGTVTQIYPNLNDSMDKIMEHLESDRWRHLDHAVRMGFRLSKALHVASGFQVKYIHYDRWTFNDSTGGILGGLVNREIDYSVAGQKDGSKDQKDGTFDLRCKLHDIRVGSLEYSDFFYSHLGRFETHGANWNSSFSNASA